MKSAEFKQLVLPFSSRLFRIANSFLNNREEAEDVVQEVYLKLWDKRKELASYDSVEALSVRMCRNMCIDHLRKHKLRFIAKEEEAHTNDGRSEDASEGLMQEERVSVMRGLINQLPEPQRSLIIFRHIEGKEYKEIEVLMGMKENAIRVSISRARKELKAMLQKQYASWIV